MAKPISLKRKATAARAAGFAVTAYVLQGRITDVALTTNSIVPEEGNAPIGEGLDAPRWLACETAATITVAQNIAAEILTGKRIGMADDLRLSRRHMVPFLCASTGSGRHDVMICQRAIAYRARVLLDRHENLLRGLAHHLAHEGLTKETFQLAILQCRLDRHAWLPER